MNAIHIPDLPWEEQHSPARKFHSFCRNVSLTLGGIRNTGTWGGGQPFDFQVRRIPPGAAVCPFHSHLAQWELFVVQAGTGTVRASEASYDVKAGDVFVHPPGEHGCPFHSHAAQWEMFVIVRGTGTVRAGNERHAVKAGDAVLHPPGEAHQITNTGDTELVFNLIADNPPADYWHYPDSRKWGLRSPRKFFRPIEADYWDGEE